MLIVYSNEYMKVQIAKLKAEAEKSDKKYDHKVGSICPPSLTWSWKGFSAMVG